MKNIILASDGKTSCRAAEEHAIQECMKHGAALSIVHVLDYSLEHYGQIDQLATEVDKRDFVNYIHSVSHKEARQYFTPLLEKAQHNKIDTTLYLEEGQLSDCLARLETTADLIIIGGKNHCLIKKVHVFGHCQRI